MSVLEKHQDSLHDRVSVKDGDGHAKTGVGPVRDNFHICYT